MADRLRVRGSVRNAVVWQSVRASLVELSAARSRDRLDILDAGGGTGGFAVPLAVLGHRVTVVDASPDSLAALERRSAEADVTSLVRGVQGDAANLAAAVGAHAFDAVVCHSVLEVVDDPAAVLSGVAASTRPGGVVSVVAANKVAAVVHRAVAGRFDEALQALRDPLGRYGVNDPVPRRFSLADLETLVAVAGLSVVTSHGSRIFADIVPGGLFDADPAAVDSLIALELAAAEHPALSPIATQLHVLARRPEEPAPSASNGSPDRR
jgi:SAM-dependent methyltransferase